MIVTVTLTNICGDQYLTIIVGDLEEREKIVWRRLVLLEKNTDPCQTIANDDDDDGDDDDDDDEEEEEDGAGLSFLKRIPTPVKQLP